MQINFPKITVLMPVYNCELYIKEAIDSILNQTYTDFEFIIIDDASTDKTVSFIKEYDDRRIKLIEKPQNSGYTNSLNLGLKLAEGKYIARMDGDDVCLPERFEKQVAFLDTNLDVIVCGSNYCIIGTEHVVCLPKENEAIKLGLLKGNCIAHPSVMIRKENLDELVAVYDVTKEPAEDYDLWVRLIAIGRIYNLQEVLLNYRVHSTQVSKKQEIRQIEFALETQLKMFGYLDYSFDNFEYDLLRKIIGRSPSITVDEINLFSILKEKMILANSNNFFETNGFEEYLLELYRKSFKIYFLEREKYFPIIGFQYFKIRSKSIFKLRLIDELKLIIKSIIYFKRK